ncbi:hypothetical protein CAC42_331 [Sphaceloma murrayae]|uniref:Nuclear segregation protein BFR1 n=1 Tax=Sphaceloma murrayae TaxID=2082308 RepID=A0A2K1QZX5_9PEZI|nr:hypothetical protein CAC42_331 [Sphaceloma murrayae]
MSTMDAKADPPATAAAGSKPSVTKPERPDEETYKKELAAAEKELQAVQEKQKANKGKLELAQPGKNNESPTGKRRAELIEERNAIRASQQSGKSGRTQVMDKVKRLDEQMKGLQAEQKTARGRMAFKSVEEINAQVERLQKQVDTGMMKLVDEKKALAEISSLNKQKKGFGGLDEAQKKIDGIKALIAEEKKKLDDPESKKMSERYAEISAELDKIKEEQDGVYKNLNQLRDERSKLHEEQQGKYARVKEIKDKYYAAKRAAAEYEKEAYRIRREKQKAENDAYHAGKRRQIAQQKLEEAGAPAYQDEILTAQGLIRYFDPSSTEAKAANGPGKFAATAIRTVDAGEIKGTALKKKGDEDEGDAYFIGGGGKKKKGGKKGAAPAGGEKFNLSIGVIEELGKVGVDTPMNQGDVPGTVEKLKQKLDEWKKDQDRKTKENIAKAQKEIDRLEAEAVAEAQGSSSGATDAGNKPAAKNQAVNGQADAGAQLAQEQDGAADAAEELKQAKIEDTNGS